MGLRLQLCSRQDHFLFAEQVVEHPKTLTVSFTTPFCTGKRGSPSGRWDTTTLITQNSQRSPSVGTGVVTGQCLKPCRKLYWWHLPQPESKVRSQPQSAWGQEEAREDYSNGPRRATCCLSSALPVSWRCTYSKERVADFARGASVVGYIWSYFHTLIHFRWPRAALPGVIRETNFKIKAQK